MLKQSVIGAIALLGLGSIVVLGISPSFVTNLVESATDNPLTRTITTFVEVKRNDANLKSPDGEVDLEKGLTTVPMAFVPQDALYDALFRSDISFLSLASNQEASGQPVTGFKFYFRDEIGLTDAEDQILASSAKNFLNSVKPLDDQANQLYEHSYYPSRDLASLQAQRTAIALQYRDQLASSLGAVTFGRLDGYVNSTFASQFQAQTLSGPAPVGNSPQICGLYEPPCIFYYGSTTTINSSARTIEGYSVTYLNYNLGLLWHPAVQGYLYRADTGSILDSGYARGVTSTVKAEVFLITSNYTENTTYCTLGRHYSIDRETGYVNLEAEYQDCKAPRPLPTPTATPTPIPTPSPTPVPPTPTPTPTPCIPKSKEDSLPCPPSPTPTLTPTPTPIATPTPTSTPTPTPTVTPTPSPTPNLNVTSVVFTQVTPSTEGITANPAVAPYNPGIGLRIFPDHDSANDTVDRRLVKVTATLSQPIPDIQVYFRNFDLDDPATDMIIDPNGNLGNDNNGTPNAGTLTMCTTTPSGCWASTNARGVATAVFTVTMQPGDNFAIAAGVTPAELEAVNMSGTELTNGSGQTIPIDCTTEPVCRSQMLTVWRRLHIEVDSMGKVHDNYMRGNVSGYTKIPAGKSTIINVITQAMETNRFENGRMEIAPVTSQLDVIMNSPSTVTVRNSSAAAITLTDHVNFEICCGNPDPTRAAHGVIIVPNNSDTADSPSLTIAPGSTVTLNVAGVVLDVMAYAGGIMSITPELKSLTVGANTANAVYVTNTTANDINIKDLTQFRLYDDDDMNNQNPMNASSLLYGDEGNDVPEPDISLLTDSSNPANNVFAPAYIVPKYDIGGSHSEVPFVANVDRYNLRTIIDSNFYNVGLESRIDFWTIYLLGAYQFEAGDTPDTSNYDADPYVEVGGIVTAAYGASDVNTDTIHTSNPNGHGSLIFAEMSRPNEWPRNYASRPVGQAYTVAHEVGHLFSCDHGEGGLMEITQKRSVGIFSDASLSWIRKANHP